MKKVLSILLAVLMLASLCTIAVTSVSAEETASNIIEYNFDSKGGVAYNRFAGGVAYRDGGLYVHNNDNQGGGIYFAKDPTYATIHKHTNTAAYDQMLVLEANTAYKVTFDYKYLAGTTYMGMDLLFATNATSTTPERYDYTLVNGYTKNTYTVTPAAALEADTEIQKAEFYFTVAESTVNMGLFLAQKANAKVEVWMDNLVIEKFNNTTILDLDFNSKTADGIASTGFDTQYNHKFDTVGTNNGAMTLIQEANSGSTMWFGKDANVNKGVTPIPATVISDATAADYAKDALELKPGTTYKITFRYRYRDDAHNAAFIEFMCAKNPFASTDHGRGSGLSGFVTYIDGNDTKATNDTFGGTSNWQDWKYETIIFTTKDVLTNKYLGMRPCYRAKKTATQFDYFMIEEIAVPEQADKDMVAVSTRAASGTGADYVSAGIRFKAKVTEDFRASATEIGFYAVPTAALNGMSLAEYVETANNIAVSAKVMADGMDEIIYAVSTDSYGRKTYDYQMIITGLTHEGYEKTMLNTKITTALYAIVDGEMVFTEEVSYSYNDFANAQ